MITTWPYLFEPLHSKSISFYVSILYIKKQIFLAFAILLYAVMKVKKNINDITSIQNYFINLKDTKLLNRSYTYFALDVFTSMYSQQMNEQSRRISLNTALCNAFADQPIHACSNRLKKLNKLLVTLT